MGNLAVAATPARTQLPRPPLRGIRKDVTPSIPGAANQKTGSGGNTIEKFSLACSFALHGYFGRSNPTGDAVAGPNRLRFSGRRRLV